MRDTAGRPWLTVAEARPGARIQADGQLSDDGTHYIGLYLVVSDE